MLWKQQDILGRGDVSTATQYWSSTAGVLLGVFCDKDWSLNSHEPGFIYIQALQGVGLPLSMAAGSRQGQCPKMTQNLHFHVAAASTNASDLKRSEQQLTAPPLDVFPLAVCFGDPSETLLCVVFSGFRIHGRNILDTCCVSGIYGFGCSGFT